MSTCHLEFVSYDCNPAKSCPKHILKYNNNECSCLTKRVPVCLSLTSVPRLGTVVLLSNKSTCLAMTNKQISSIQVFLTSNNMPAATGWVLADNLGAIVMADY